MVTRGSDQLFFAMIWTIAALGIAAIACREDSTVMHGLVDTMLVMCCAIMLKVMMDDQHLVE